MIFNDGSKLEGIWNEDNLDGDVKKIYPDGRTENLFFQNGYMLS